MPPKRKNANQNIQPRRARRAPARFADEDDAVPAPPVPAGLPAQPAPAPHQPEQHPAPPQGVDALALQPGEQQAAPPPPHQAAIQPARPQPEAPPAQHAAPAPALQQAAAINTPPQIAHTSTASSPQQLSQDDKLNHITQAVVELQNTVSLLVQRDLQKNPQQLSINPSDTSANTVYNWQQLASTSSSSSNLMGSASVGSAITTEIKTKIITDKFVNFHQLITPAADDDAYRLGIDNTSGSPAVKFIPNKPKILNEANWLRAFDEFMAVYLTGHPTETMSLLSYAKHIKAMMRNKDNWRYYDEQFRREREENKYSFATIRVDLMFQATKTDSQQTQETKNLSTPNGYCYKFHSENERCENRNCMYKHSCFRCHRKHPAYKKCFDNSANRNDTAPNSSQSKATGSNTEQIQP